MSNIFKSGSSSGRFSFDNDWNKNDNEKKRRDRKRESNKKQEYKDANSSEKVNKFSYNESKKPIFSIENDFPELGSNTKKENIPKSENKKFSDVAKPVTKEDVIEEVDKPFFLEEGYVCYMREKDNKIRIEYGPKTKFIMKKEIVEKEERIPTTEEIMYNIIDVILKNREKFKTNFIELQGEDEYERIYGKEVEYEEEEEEEEEEEYNDAYDDYDY